MLRATIALGALNDLRKQVNRSMATATLHIAQYATNAALAEARARVPVKTGDLKRSIKITESNIGYDSAWFTIEPTVDWAKYVESDTKPHIIRARNVEFLKFTIGGRTIFRRSVRHPGTRAQPFMGPAYLKAESSIRAIAETELQQIADRLNQAA